MSAAREIERAAIAARAVATRRSSGGSPGIVKVISGARSRSGAQALLRYVGRLGENMSDPAAPDLPIRDREVRLFDGSGLTIPREKAAAALDAWQLLTDGENLSRRASRARAAGEAWADLPDAERLRLVQVRHLVYSARCRDAWEERLLEAATIAAVRETLVAMGHRVIVGMHREHGSHPHVHVLVRVENDDPGGPRLRFRPDGRLVDGLRHAFSRHCVEVGLAADGSRWSDRAEVIAAAERGELPARQAGPQPRPGRPGRRGRGTGPTRLAEAAPDWWADYGADALLRMQARRRRARAQFEARRAGVAPLQMPPPPVPAPRFAPAGEALAGNVPDASAGDAGRERGGLINRLVTRVIGRAAPASDASSTARPSSTAGPSTLAGAPLPPGSPADIRGAAAELLVLLRRHQVFEEEGRDRSVEAMRSYLRLRAADRKLADWYLIRQPILFGPITTGADSLRGAPELAPLLARIGLSDAPSLLAPAGAAGGGRPREDLAAVMRLVARERLVRGMEGLAASIERDWPDDAPVLEQAITLRDRAWRIEKAPLRVVPEPAAPAVPGGRDAPEPGTGGRGRRGHDGDRDRRR